MNRKHMLLALALLLCALTLAACGSKAAETAPAEEKAAGLTIDASTLAAEPSFIDWTQDGTAMQLIALKDEGGQVRLAYNTCQSCGGSPYAWFEYVGKDTLQCQNCGLTFSTATVGTARAAGCNPVTISEFTVEGDTVTVPETVLAEGAPRFANWKAFEG